MDEAGMIQHSSYDTFKHVPFNFYREVFKSMATDFLNDPWGTKSFMDDDENLFEITDCAEEESEQKKQEIRDMGLKVYPDDYTPALFEFTLYPDHFSELITVSKTIVLDGGEYTPLNYKLSRLEHSEYHRKKLFVGDSFRELDTGTNIFNKLLK
jgi:hypothetical protein